MRTEPTAVPAPAGELRGRLYIPDLPDPLPGMVLVDGSGEGSIEEWGGWAERLAGLGAVVLTHDKPGCGDSPGDWMNQSIPDRASESLAALRVLRPHPAVGAQAIGFFGVSQGGWVALLAASQRTDPEVSYVVSLSGPGVSPAVQDRFRIETELRSKGATESVIAEALRWIDERTRRLLGGEPVESVLAEQARFSDHAWYATATRYFDNPAALAYMARMLDFEPAEVLPLVPCPVLAVFGGSDPLVPVPQSLTTYATCLPTLPGDPHGLAVFPGANHGLFIAEPDSAVPRTDQLAPGFLPMVAGFLAARRLPCN